LKVKTGRTIGQSTWQGTLIEEVGSPYLTVHVSPGCRHVRHLTLIFHDVQHADLLQTLHGLASSAGARVTFGAIVESVEPAPDASSESGRSTPITGHGPSTLRPTVRLKTGEVLQADVIVGADGLRSIVRRVVSNDETEPPSTGLNTYMGGVPMSEVCKCAPLKQLADVGWMVWMGDGRVVSGASSKLGATIAAY
jgi:salicylate hydroxylase